jgi:serine protease Do
MKLIPLFIFIMFFIQSCDRSEIDKLIENHEEQKPNSIEKIKNKNSIKSNYEKNIDIADLLLKTSVTVSNYDGSKKINSGSGVFISKNLLVTNFHVVQGGDNWEIIRFSDNKKFKAKIRKVDRIHDVCILELIDDRVNIHLNINDKYPKIGSDIIVAGSPIGLDGTITKGNISNIQREEPFDYELLQISAPISPGNSGGPVVNLKGELIGITVSSIVGQGIQNINFAVPSKYIMFLMHE